MSVSCYISDFHVRRLHASSVPLFLLDVKYIYFVHFYSEWNIIDIICFFFMAKVTCFTDRMLNIFVLLRSICRIYCVLIIFSFFICDFNWLSNDKVQDNRRYILLIMLCMYVFGFSIIIKATFSMLVRELYDSIRFWNYWTVVFVSSTGII